MAMNKDGLAKSLLARYCYCYCCYYYCYWHCYCMYRGHRYRIGRLAPRDGGATSTRKSII